MSLFLHIRELRSYKIYEGVQLLTNYIHSKRAEVAEMDRKHKETRRQALDDVKALSKSLNAILDSRRGHDDD